MALFPCSNLSSDGKLQDLGYFHLMWTSWSSLLQQQQQTLGLFSTHSQALGTAAQYQRLTHPCAAHIHSCCSYWLCCSEISASVHERVVVTVRIYLLLAHVCLICYLDYYYHRMAEIGKDLWRWSALANCSSKATRCWLPRLPTQLLKCLQGWKLHSLTAPVLSHWTKEWHKWHLCLGLLLLRCRTLHFMRFLSAHFPIHTVLLYMK